MTKPFLKDINSKNQLFTWLTAGMKNYAASSMSCWADEDFLCGHFFSSISGSCTFGLGEFKVGNFKIRGRGPSAPEKKIGADGIGIIDLKYPDISLKGFFLYQAKKAVDQRAYLGKAKEECSVMLTHTPASYLLVLMPAEVKMVGAMAVNANLKTSLCLNDLPFVNYPRFIIEHILHGIMLEPYANLRPTLSLDVSNEIKHISTFVGGSKKYIDEAEKIIKEEIRGLDWKIESDQVHDQRPTDKEHKE